MILMPKYIPPKTNLSQENQINTGNKLLRMLSQKGLSQHLLNLNLSGLEPAYTSRLESELQIIEDKNVCEYFLIVADYVQWARDQGIAVGPGRGSGPSSLVGFALGITKVDPIKYGLVFERFFNPDRNLSPDFDIDFCEDRKGEVLTYIQSKYGFDKVAHIYAKEIESVRSHLVIADRPLSELIPIKTNSEPKFNIAKVSLEQVSDAGLVQFKLVNQNLLNLIQNRVLNLKKTGITIDIDNIPLVDDSTYNLLSTGLAANMTSLDDENYRATLRAVKPRRFEELCAVIALCQPGLQNIIPLYVKNKQGSNFKDRLHLAVESITKETFGLIIYQEQVMHIAHKIAGFSLAQSDLFRRAMQKSDFQKIKFYKSKFMEGSAKLGISSVEATRVFEYVITYGQYCFNKSHAVAFAMLAYQSAWLKVNYPIQ